MSRPMRESFGWCKGSWCSPYRTRMDRCYNQNAGPIYDDRLRRMCETQLAENFGNQTGALPGVSRAGAPYGGANKNFIRLLNQGNMNIENFDPVTDAYAFVPHEMSGQVKGPPSPVDSEHVESMGEHLKMSPPMVEHLTQKVPGQNFTFMFGDPRGPQVIESDAYGPIESA